MKQRINDRNAVEMIFYNLPENERIGRTMAAVYAAALDPTMEELCDFKTAVSEAVTNAIIHAYPDSAGKIVLRFERQQKEIKVTVVDYGKGIKHLSKAMEPLYTTIKTGERSGMGFTFMEAFSDDLKVTSVPGRGTTVFLTKKISGTAGDQLSDDVENGDPDNIKGENIGPYL